MNASGRQLAIIAAALDEVRPTIRRLGLSGSFPCFHGQVGATCISLTITGPGAGRAVTAVKRMIDEDRPQRLALIGFAGGLDPAWRAGRLMVCRRVIDARGSAYDLTGPAPSPGADSPHGHDPQTTLVSVAEPLETTQAKARCWQSWRAAGADMESFAIAGVAAERGLPLLVVRAISDPADFALPPGISRWLLPDGRPDVATVAGDLLRHPQHLAKMPHLIRCCRAAAQALVDWAVDQFAVR